MNKIISSGLIILLILLNSSLSFVSAHGYDSASSYYSYSYKDSRPMFKGPDAEVYQIRRTYGYSNPYSYYDSYPSYSYYPSYNYVYFSGGPYFSGGYYGGFYSSYGMYGYY